MKNTDEAHIYFCQNRTDFNEFQKTGRVLRNAIINIYHYDDKDLWEHSIRTADFSPFTQLTHDDFFPKTYNINFANKEYTEDEKEIL